MKEFSTDLRKVREYESEALKGHSENKLPVFHMKVPMGWMNDPNGFSLYSSIIPIPGNGDPCTGGT